MVRKGGYIGNTTRKGNNGRENNGKSKSKRKPTIERVWKIEGPKHLYTTGELEGRKVRVFVDSGSSVTMVSSLFVKSMGLSNQIQPSNIKIKSFTDDLVPVEGKIRLTLQVANQKLIHEFLITNCLDSDVLMGLDYLTEAALIIDIPASCMKSEFGSTTFITNPRSTERAAKIRTIERVEIGPHSVQYIQGKLPGERLAPRDKYGLIDGSYNLSIETGLLVADSVCYSEGYNVMVQVINPTENTVVLQKRKILGKYCPVIIGDEDVHGVFRVEGSVKREQGKVVTVENKQVMETKERPPWEKDVLFKRLQLDNITDLNPEQLDQVKTLIWEHKECFSKNSEDLGKCNMFEADIELKKDARPKWISSRPVAYKLRSAMQDEIDAQIRAGVIEEFKGKSEWNSPVMIVKKPSGQGYRFVMDARALNSQTVPSNYSLPNVQRVLDDMKDCDFLSSLDVTCSFNQIILKESARPLTAFTYDRKRYIHKMLVMGIRNSSSIFSQMIDTLMGRVPYSSLTWFLDDLICGSKTISEHLVRLAFILGKLMSAGLKLRPEKCHLFKREVTFVGYTVSKDGIKIDNTRIQPILDIQPPISKKGVQSIVGIFNYNRQFIKGFAGLARPLYKLLRKESKFVWTVECQDSLDALKEAMTTAPCLALPDTDDANHTFRVEVDASNIAFGAVLTQVIKGERKVIAYYSKAVPDYKRRMSASRLEFLALYHCLNYWRPYLQNGKVEIWTDCIALTNLETLFHKSNRVQQRQMEFLQHFDLTITHVSGESHTQADFLSRPWWYGKTSKSTQTLEHPMVHSQLQSNQSADKTGGDSNGKKEKITDGNSAGVKEDMYQVTEAPFVGGLACLDEIRDELRRVRRGGTLSRDNCNMVRAALGSLIRRHLYWACHLVDLWEAFLL